MSATKILYIIDKPGVGGAATHLTAVLRRLDRSRFAPSLCFLLRGGEAAEPFRRLGVPMRVVGLRRVYGLRGWLALPALVRWIRRERFAIVHTYLFSANVYGVVAARLAGIPVIISARREVVTWMRPHHRFAIRLANRCCRAVTVNSEAIRRSVLACEGLPSERIETIYNGVDLSRFRPPTTGASDQGPVIMTIGHLSPIKGQRDLLEALPEVLRAHPAATLVLVGDGPMRGELVRSTARLGVERHVRFLGTRTDVERLLPTADLVVVPSRSEGFSNALLEAMAAGAAIIATNVGGNPEAIRHGENGWLVPARDPAALATAVRALLADPALRARLGTAARRTVEERFDAARMVEAIQALYVRLLAVHAPARPLGIITSQFPETHETFVARELKALADAGLPLRIYSLKRCRDRIVHPDAEAMQASTVCVAWDDAATWVQALREILRHPWRALSALGWIVRHHPWPPVTLAKALMVWGQSLAVARRMRRDGVAHVHAHWATMPTTAAVVASRWLGIPFSFTAHAWDLFVRNPSLKAKVELAARVITCTDYGRRYLNHLCPSSRDKIALSYHGVDLRQFGMRNAACGMVEDLIPHSPFRIPNGVSGTPLLLSVGRLVETKGYETLLEAYRLLKQRGIAFRAVIVGAGPQRRRLARRLRRDGLAWVVELRPTMTQGALRALYGEAFAFVLPCEVAGNGDRDGIPNVILEAQACGLPVVTTTISGIPEAVQDRRNGMLVPPRAPERLAEALEALLRRPTWARVLGDHGRMWVETQFDARHHLQRLVGQMRNLLEWGMRNAACGIGPNSPFPIPHSALRASSDRVGVMYVIWALEVGGAERIVLSLAKGLDRSRYRPMVVCIHRRGRLADELEAAGVPVVSLDKRSGLDLSVVPKLVRLMRRERVAVVHTHLWTANLWGRLAAWLAGVPVIIATEHNVDVWKRRVHVWCDRLLCRRSHSVVCVSERVRLFYQQRLPGVDGKLVKIYNGIDAARYRNGTRSLRPPADGEWAGRFPVIVAIGRLVPAKGYAYLIEAAAQLRARYPSLQVLVIGEGPLALQLARQIQAAGLGDTVHLTGLRQDIPFILHQAHLLVLPSLREGLPMVALEAMAAGLPVVATDVGGNREAIADGQTGLLVPPEDPEALAEAIQALLDDHAFYARASAQGQQRVLQRFSVERMVAENDALYQRALRRGGG